MIKVKYDISEQDDIYKESRYNETRCKIICLEAFINHLKEYQHTPDNKMYNSLEELIASIDPKLLEPSLPFNALKETVEMYSFYRRGKTLDELATWYDMTKQGVHQRFMRYGLQTRRSWEKPNDATTNNN